MSVILETKNLRKYFKTPHGYLHAVEDVSLQINRGETMGIVGESGCGKSTLGRTILHLLEPTGGEIWFDGENITGVRGKQLKELRRHMQIIFQDPFSSLNPRMTVGEIIGEPLKIYRVTKSKEEYHRRITELMDLVGLAQRNINSYPHEFDGGRRQRIGIARALCLNPSFIVCDEPVSALDVSIQAQILNLLQELQDELGLTLMFITHDLSVVRHISQHICVMYLGQLVEKAPAKELFVKNYHPYTRALLSAIPIPSIHVERERVPIKGELSSPINPKPGCRFASRCPYAKDVCREATPELREISPEHFTACHFALEL